MTVGTLDAGTVAKTKDTAILTSCRLDNLRWQVYNAAEELDFPLFTAPVEQSRLVRISAMDLKLLRFVH